MTGNLLTLLALGTVALAAFAWRLTSSRPAMIRVRNESALPRRSDESSEG